MGPSWGHQRLADSTPPKKNYSVQIFVIIFTIIMNHDHVVFIHLRKSKPMECVFLSCVCCTSYDLVEFFSIVGLIRLSIYQNPCTKHQQSLAIC